MTKIYNKHSQKFKRIKLREDQTESEELLWKYLRNKKMCGVKFKRQYSVDNFVIDFYAPTIKLAIELDGEIHNSTSQKEYDKLREEHIERTGIKFLRIKNSDLDNVTDVLNKISSLVTSLLEKH